MEFFIFIFAVLEFVAL